MLTLVDWRPSCWCVREGPFSGWRMRARRAVAGAGLWHWRLEGKEDEVRASLAGGMRTGRVSLAL